MRRLASPPISRKMQASECYPLASRPKTVQTTPSEDLETPIGALSSLDFGDYDRVIAEFRKKNAEKEAARERAREAVQKLIDQITALLARFPMLEATNLAEDFRKMELAERALLDGIVPDGVGALASSFKNSRDQVTQIQKNITKVINALCPHVVKIDPTLGADLRRQLNEVGRLAKRLLTHYQHMIARVNNLAAAVQSPPRGRVLEAYELYKSAFQSLPGIHAVGRVFPDFQHTPPLYE
jgi:hypothetical protein